MMITTEYGAGLKRWLRGGLCLVAAGSLAAILVCAIILFVLGDTADRLAAVGYWGAAVALILLWRVRVAADRRPDGAKMSDECPNSKPAAAREEDRPRGRDT